ncbi:TspO/MBR family protein [Nioella nitratireducens]|uniref:TspO/MBR family protein n=1 Tax=Nioella nitratireducens TaxID=1287720 RepID=UPI001F2ABB7D|nr:TspO/MBR family protein [Nioella nitratireducens]
MVLFVPLNPAHLAYAMRRYPDIRLFLKVSRIGLFPVFLMTRAAAGAADVFFQPGPRPPAPEPRQAGLASPKWMFPVIWAALYVLIALAATWISEVPDNDLALGLWEQITINTLWLEVFFGLRRMLAGAVIIAALWVAVLATTMVFWEHDMIAALLTFAYLIWGTYALALNISVWLRNRDRADPAA